MHIRLWIAACTLLASVLIPRSAQAQSEAWVGRTFLPRQQCSPKVGKQPVSWEQLALPFKVQKVEGDWLWMGEAWVNKLEVAPLAEPIEEFAIARHGDWPLVPVTIGGREYQFLIDTGSTCCVVDRSLQSALTTTGTTSRVNGKADMPVYQLQRTFVGKTRIPVTGTAVCIDLQPFRECSGHDVRGILGMSFLKGRVVMLDFDAGRMTLLPSLPTDVAGATMLYYNETGIPALNLDIADRRTVTFRLDTGFLGGTAGNLDASTIAGLTWDGSLKDTGRRSGLTWIHGDVPAREVQLSRTRLGAYEHQGLPFIEGHFNVLGLGYLSRYFVVFDFQNNQLLLKRGQRYDKPNRQNMLGARLVRRGGDTLVLGINPATPAYDGGLRDGDRILSIDRRDTGEFSLFELRSLCSDRGRRISLVAQGNAEPRELTVELAEWGKTQSTGKVPQNARQ